MISLINEDFVGRTAAVVSIHDRSFRYGDGVFETVRFQRGRPFRWDDHFDRLRRGAEFLRIVRRWDSAWMLAAATELLHRNERTTGLVRIQLSRGEGRRGYSPQGADATRLVMTCHEAPDLPDGGPETRRLMSCSYRVFSGDPLVRFKTACRLLNVLARDEAEQLGGDEALLLNERGELAGTSSANLFWVRGDRVFTPPLAAGPLPGVTRGVVLGLGASLGIPVEEGTGTLDDLRRADGVFLTLTSYGVIEVSELDGTPVPRSEQSRRIYAAYREQLEG